MARILYWNINNFSRPKVLVAAPVAAALEATQRLNYIVQNVMRGPVGGPIPDIIVVVEIFSRIREVGSEGTPLRATLNAGIGVRTLLAQLRADAVIGTVAAGTNWCVVPPLNLGLFGQREAVAVYYNAVNLQFTGPNLLWQLFGGPGNPVGQSQPVTAATHAAIMNYSAGWTNAMPALGRTTTFPVMGGGNVVIPENQLAGEWQYYDTTMVPRPIPSPLPPAIPVTRIQFPYEGCRAPFYTRFLDGGGRTLHIFSVHTSPGSARQAIQHMQDVQEMNAAPAATHVNVILGDFNVDTFGNHWGVYNWMMPPLGHYTCQFDPRVAHAGAPVPARKPYLMTHFLPTVEAMPYNAQGVPPNPQQDVYPRFGYMGSAWPAINDTGAIDNIFTAYGAGAAGPATNPTVVNTVTGTPYSYLNAAPPPGVTPELRNSLPFNSTMPIDMLTATPPANIGTGGINGPNLVFEGIFQNWNYFGKIYSTSDHMPLMIDI